METKSRNGNEISSGKRFEAKMVPGKQKWFPGNDFLMATKLFQNYDVSYYYDNEFTNQISNDSEVGFRKYFMVCTKQYYITTKIG